ncbi:MAG: glycerophosphodiester phosphodiesterase family protein [Clostridia bacterium]
MGFYIALPVLLLAGLYLFLIAPGKKDISELKGWHYSHRGLHDLGKGIPENTLPAFEQAIANNYGIELDVHLTADDQLVVFHDDDLRHAAGMDMNIHDTGYEEISQHPVYASPYHIPLFSQVLSLVSGRVPLIVEIKSCKRYTELCVKVSEMLKNYQGPLCIESFDPRIVKWFRVNRPDITRGQLSSSMFKSNLHFSTKVIMTFMLMNFTSKPHFIAYMHENAGNLSFLLCRKLFKANTVAWTLRSKEELETARAMFDLFIFEGFIP